MDSRHSYFPRTLGVGSTWACRVSLLGSPCDTERPLTCHTKKAYGAGCIAGYSMDKILVTAVITAGVTFICSCAVIICEMFVLIFH